MTKLVELMDLPSMGPDGQPLSYKFHHKQTGRQIGDHETLEAASVQDDLRDVSTRDADRKRLRLGHDEGELTAQPLSPHRVRAEERR